MSGTTMFGPNSMLRSIARRVVHRVLPATRLPHPFETLAKRAREVPLDNITIILSFDCDTPRDAIAAQTLDAGLAKRGVPRTYAVPGLTLTEAADYYRVLAIRGAHFINHGARAHTEFKEGSYQAITFYNEMTSQEVIADIREGHRIVSDVIGIAPCGFRAPHFGYFQQPEQRKLVYDTARLLGYRFCSDTLPASAYARGPVFDVGGLYEFPLSGSHTDPNTILDSWNYLADRVNYRMSKDFFVLFTATVDFFADRRLPALLNFYVDPSHVANDSYFLDAVDHAISRGARFAGFEDVLARIGSGAK
jgi:hypothetical protein